MECQLGHSLRAGLWMGAKPPSSAAMLFLQACSPAAHLPLQVAQREQRQLPPRRGFQPLRQAPITLPIHAHWPGTHLGCPRICPV